METGYILKLSAAKIGLMDDNDVLNQTLKSFVNESTGLHVVEEIKN